jgi:hypothetical protein
MFRINFWRKKERKKERKQERKKERKKERGIIIIIIIIIIIRRRRRRRNGAKTISLQTSFVDLITCGGHAYTRIGTKCAIFIAMFHRCFLPSFGSFGLVVSEKKIFFN